MCDGHVRRASNQKAKIVIFFYLFLMYSFSELEKTSIQSLLSHGQGGGGGGTWRSLFVCLFLLLLLFVVTVVVCSFISVF